jgi:hypothetical protein
VPPIGCRVENDSALLLDTTLITLQFLEYFFTEADAKLFAELGMNCLRLPVSIELKCFSQEDTIWSELC